MSPTDYQTGAIYDNEDQARQAFEAITGVTPARPDITLLEPDPSGADSRSAQAAHHYLATVIQGALPGAGSGVSHSPDLFVSAHILFGLVIALRGARDGGGAGAGVALELGADTLAAVLDAASRSGHWCLVIHTGNRQDHDRILALLSRQPVAAAGDGGERVRR